MTARLKIIIGLVLLLMMTFIGASLNELFKTGYLRLNYPSTEIFPVRGIDVSHHQGQIQWKKLAAQHIHFAYIKASEGGDFRDEDFAQNWAAAKTAGIVPGAYHYFTLCKSGKEQAENFLSYIVKPGPGVLPPAVDVEFGGNCKARPRADEFRDELAVFINTVEETWGCPVVLYSTDEFYDAYLKKQFAENPLWIRDIYRQPNKKIYGDWQFWQYANRGRLKGIKGFVDLNVWQGDEAEFNSLLNCSMKTESAEK
jgi:lysozyme